MTVPKRMKLNPTPKEVAIRQATLYAELASLKQPLFEVYRAQQPLPVEYPNELIRAETIEAMTPKKLPPQIIPMNDWDSIGCGCVR